MSSSFYNRPTSWKKLKPTTKPKPPKRGRPAVPACPLCTSLSLLHVSAAPKNSYKFYFLLPGFPCSLSQCLHFGLETMKKLWWHIFIKWLLASLSEGSGGTNASANCICSEHILLRLIFVTKELHYILTIRNQEHHHHMFLRQAQLLFSDFVFESSEYSH